MKHYRIEYRMFKLMKHYIMKYWMFPMLFSFIWSAIQTRKWRKIDSFIFAAATGDVERSPRPSPPRTRQSTREKDRERKETEKEDRQRQKKEDRQKKDNKDRENKEKKNAKWFYLDEQQSFFYFASQLRSFYKVFLKYIIMFLSCILKPEIYLFQS